MTTADAMDDADFVLIDGVVFETDYLRVPDEFTVADDVVLEATRGDTEIAFTRAEIDDAEHLGDGVYRLKNGAPAALPRRRDAFTSGVPARRRDAVAIAGRRARVLDIRSHAYMLICGMHG